MTPEPIKKKGFRKLRKDLESFWSPNHFVIGAGGRNRTDMGLPPRDFESRASTSFTTPARTIYYPKPNRVVNKIEFVTTIRDEKNYRIP